MQRFEQFFSPPHIFVRSGKPETLWTFCLTSTLFLWTRALMAAILDTFGMLHLTSLHRVSGINVLGDDLDSDNSFSVDL